jgi:hypothetical protein
MLFAFCMGFEIIRKFLCQLKITGAIDDRVWQKSSCHHPNLKPKTNHYEACVFIASKPLFFEAQQCRVAP